MSLPVEPLQQVFLIAADLHRACPLSPFWRASKRMPCPARPRRPDRSRPDVLAVRDLITNGGQQKVVINAPAVCECSPACGHRSRATYCIGCTPYFASSVASVTISSLDMPRTVWQRITPGQRSTDDLGERHPKPERGCDVAKPSGA